MKELLSLLTWQLPAAQDLYRHLSSPSPPPSAHTLDCTYSLLYKKYMLCCKIGLMRKITVVFPPCQETAEFVFRCDKGSSVLHFIFIKLTILFNKSKFFFIKAQCKIWQICSIWFLKNYSQLFHIIYNSFLTQRTLPPYSHKMEPKYLSPCTTYCPITGPSPHMRQLLDSGTCRAHGNSSLYRWHPYSHPPCTVLYFTAGISSFLHRNTWKN